jgi:acyl-CoA thioesterase FadM
MMSYLLRYLRILVMAYFRPRMRPTDTSVVHFIAWPFDCEMKALNGARMFALMDNARLDFVARTGIFEKMVKNGWLIVLGAQRITYFRPVPLFARFRIEARIVSWRDRWFVCECKLFHKNQLAAIGHQRGLLRGRRGSVTAQEVLASAGFPDNPPPLPPDLAQWIENEDQFYRSFKDTSLG